MAGDPVAQPVYPTIIHHLSDMVQGAAVSTTASAICPSRPPSRARSPRPARPQCRGADDRPSHGQRRLRLGNGVTSEGPRHRFGRVPPREAARSADAKPELSHASSQSTLSAPRATSLLLGGGYDVAPSWRADLSLGIDVASRFDRRR